MSDDRRTINLDKWLRTHVRVLNDMGQRGFDQGVRTFNCPLCRDTKGRGWVHVAYWTAGCFNVGCEGHERLDHGAIELVRRLEKLRMRADAMGFLRREYGTARPIEYKLSQRESENFVRWPEGMKPLARKEPGPVDPWQRTFLKFVETQWNITEADAALWGLGYCLTGYYAKRVIIPIVQGGEPVAFQARTIEQKFEKKYITSRYGPKSDPRAECALPASGILYNYDRIREGGEALVVEGVGDVMGWHRGTNFTRQPTATAMLGVSLTPEKLALLEAKKLTRIMLAADAEPQAQKQADELYDTLRAWDLPVILCTWDGGKDAGTGARPVERTAPTREDRMRALIRKSS